MANEVSAQLEPWCNLQDKVVLVTGASSGLGRYFCLDLAKAGCKVVAAARRFDRLQSLCNEINLLPFPNTAGDPSGPRAAAVELDVSADGAAIDQAVQKAWEVFGKIDALINNAGIRGSVKTPLDLSEEEWNQAMKTNLTGTWLVSRSVGIRMRDAKLGGSMINISSVDGLSRGHSPGGVGYVCSKTGVNAMTKVMALELGVHKIRVNSISPGLFKSEITEGLMHMPWLTSVVEKAVPLRTIGTVDPALTSVIRYLIHDSSQYVTGNIFIVDAGTTLSGLGRDLCLDLAKAGCKVVAAARRIDRLQSLCNEINLLPFPTTAGDPSGPRAAAVELDVSADGAAVDKGVQKAWEVFGRIDALINNAGIRGSVSTPLDLCEEEWNRVMKTNLTGTWLVSKSVGIRMRDAKLRGSMINISSVDGLNRGYSPGGVGYVCSKTGVNATTKVMAMELGVHKIRVNAISHSPGLFKTEINQGLMEIPWLPSVVQKAVPLRTYGTVDPALTSIVRYLIHDSSQYVTGNIFIVDGGTTLSGVPIFSSL
ncbi:Glucose 1-dehydrogenase [Linum grandiflorum]